LPRVLSDCFVDLEVLYLKKFIKNPVDLADERSYDNTKTLFCQRNGGEKKIFFIIIFLLCISPEK